MTAPRYYRGSVTTGLALVVVLTALLALLVSAASAGLDKIRAAAAEAGRSLDGFVAAHLTFITVGRDYGAQLEITSGLRVGDAVIVNPTDDLRDGQRVHARPRPEGEFGAMQIRECLGDVEPQAKPAGHCAASWLSHTVTRKS